MSDQIHTVAPSPSLETLSEAIRSIDQCSQECFSEISAVAQLALASLESPEAYRNLDSLAYALRAIWGRAEEAQNLVNDQASEVGCGYVDEAKRRRWAAHAAARQKEPCHAMHELAMTANVIKMAPRQTGIDADREAMIAVAPAPA